MITERRLSASGPHELLGRRRCRDAGEGRRKGGGREEEGRGTGLLEKSDVKILRGFELLGVMRHFKSLWTVKRCRSCAGVWKRVTLNF